MCDTGVWNVPDTVQKLKHTAQLLAACAEQVNFKFNLVIHILYIFTFVSYYTKRGMMYNVDLWWFVANTLNRL